MRTFLAIAMLSFITPVALGAPDGSVWLSGDAGKSWQAVASDLPAVRAVAFSQA